MGGWTGRGKDRIIWDGVISINGIPVEPQDLITKNHIDDNFVPYTGAVSDVELGNKDLTVNTIHKGIGMVAYYQMEDAVGGAVSDSFGNNDGTGFPDAGILVVDNAADFDQLQAQKISIVDSGDLDLSGGSGFAIEFWFKSFTSPEAFLLNKGNYQIKWIIDNFPHGHVEATVNSVTVNSGNLIASTIYNVVVDWDGTTLKLYIDNVLADSSALASVGTSSNDLEMGESFKGLIDEVALYNESLSDEVRALHRSRALDDGLHYTDLFHGGNFEANNINARNDVNAVNVTATGTVDTQTLQVDLNCQIDGDANIAGKTITKSLVIGAGKQLVISEPTGSNYVLDFDVSDEDNKSFKIMAGAEEFMAFGVTSFDNMEIGESFGQLTLRGKTKVTGDFFFSGSGTGLPYGFVEGDHINWTQANAVQNTWYNISDADMTTGFLNNTTHDGNGKITILKPGIYWVFFNIAYEVNAANVHVELGIEVDGSGSANATGPHAHTTSKFANQEQESTSGALMSLALNSTIETAIRTTDAGTPNFIVDNVHLTAYQIGGR